MSTGQAQKHTIRMSFILFFAVLSVGCNSTTDEGTIGISSEINGVWASYCEYNPTSQYYETIDYDIYGNNASILLTSYNNARCTNVIDQTLYTGTVTQTGTVILGNGLRASELRFYAVDQNSGVSIEYVSYFHADPFTLYEYTNPSSNYTFEFVRV